MKIRSLLLISVISAASPVLADDLSAHSTAVVLSEGTTQADLNAQIVANRAYRRAHFEAFAAAGGCNAEFLTTEQSSYCWNRGAYGQTDANPFPQIGASSGGSE